MVMGAMTKARHIKLRVFMSDFDLFSPKQPKARIIEAHADVVRDVKEFISNKDLLIRFGLVTCGI